MQHLTVHSYNTKTALLLFPKQPKLAPEMFIFSATMDESLNLHLLCRAMAKQAQTLQKQKLSCGQYWPGPLPGFDHLSCPSWPCRKRHTQRFYGKLGVWRLTSSLIWNLLLASFPHIFLSSFVKDCPPAALSWALEKCQKMATHILRWGIWVCVE